MACRELLSAVRGNLCVEEWLRGSKPAWFLEQLDEEQRGKLASPKAAKSSRKAKQGRQGSVAVA